MLFVLLLYANAQDAAVASDEEAKRELAMYRSVTDEMEAAGVFRYGEALLPGEMAVQVSQVKASERSAVHLDPELSGFYVIDCETLEDASSWAGKLPVIEHGVVEVRPVFDGV